MIHAAIMLTLAQPGAASLPSGDGASAALATPPPPRDRHGGRLFVSPMGEPFRGDGDTTPVALWFAQADADHDGRLTRAEFAADAARFYATLDLDHDGEIDPAEIEHYETEVLPGGGGGGGRSGGGGGGRGPGGGGHHGGPGGGRGGFGGGHRERGGGASGGDSAAGEPLQGAARFSFLADPEPVASADANFNRGVTLEEFRQAADRRFALLDGTKQGYLTLATLPPLPSRDALRRHAGERRGGGTASPGDDLP